MFSELLALLLGELLFLPNLCDLSTNPKTSKLFFYTSLEFFVRKLSPKETVPPSRHLVGPLYPAVKRLGLSAGKDPFTALSQSK